LQTVSSTTAGAATKEIGSALTNAGVLSTDPIVVVAEKIKAKFGGFQIHL